MIDVANLIKKKISRRKIPSTVGEDISEKQTSKLGNFLLFLMFISILWSSFWSLSIINKLIIPPTNIPICVTEVIKIFNNKDLSQVSGYNDYYLYGKKYNNCKLISLEKIKYDFSQEYSNIKPAYLKIREKFILIGKIRQQIRIVQNNLQGAYGSRTDLLNALVTSQNTNKKNDKIVIGENKIKNIIREVESIKRNYKKQYDELNKKYLIKSEEYKTAYILYKFIIASLSVLFIFSLFIFFYKIYSNYKKKNSPYTIIFSVVVFAYGLMLIKVLFSLVWDIIPISIIRWLSEVLFSFKPLLYIIQFLWPILIILLFGFFIYKIQKRIYSSSNIIKRIIKDQKCPKCSNIIDSTKKYCPMCSYEILRKCNFCGKETIKDLPYCYHCKNKQ